MALALALIGQIALIYFFWNGAGARAGGITFQGGEGSIVTVHFGSISPRVAIPAWIAVAQPTDVAINAVSEEAAANNAASNKAMPVVDGDEPPATKKAAAPELGGGHGSQVVAAASPRT